MSLTFSNNGAELFLLSPPIWPVFEYELDAIFQIRCNTSKEVVIFVCEGEAPFCPANQSRNPLICLECRSRRDTGLKIFATDSKVSVRRFYQKTATHNQDLTSIAAKIVDFIFNTTVVTQNKSKSPSFSLSKRLNRRVFEDCISAVHFFSSLSLEVSSATIYNGRVAKYGVLHLLCKKVGIPLRIIEYPLHGYKRYILFPDDFLQNMRVKSKIWKEREILSSVSRARKISLGGRWLDARIKKSRVGWEPIYANGQVSGLLPVGWSPHKFNIVIFNSSDWEVSFLSANNRDFFATQDEVIFFLARHFKKDNDVRVYLRLHPQLAVNDAKSTMVFSDVEEDSENFHVIPARSEVDTYEVVRSADLIITFYSMIGIESMYLKTPTLCVGPAAYMDFVPDAFCSSPEELLSKISDVRDVCDRSYLDRHHESACLYAFSRMFSGEKSKIVRRKSYRGNELRLNGVKILVQPSRMIWLMNSILFAIPKLIVSMRRLSRDKRLRKQISRSGLGVLLRDAIGFLSYRA